VSKLVIVVEKMADWGSYYPTDEVISASDYLKAPIAPENVRTQVINLCRNYKYLGVGYYVSLLAEARGHRVIPSVRTLNDLRKRSVYGVDIEDLNQKLAQLVALSTPDVRVSSFAKAKQHAQDHAGAASAEEFSALLYFGETSYEPIAEFARELFEAFPTPILRVEFERQSLWQVTAIKPVALNALADAQEDAFAAAVERFSKKLWRTKRSPKKYRYDIAMLHDPSEQWPPSDKRALKSFIKAGKDLGIEVDLITRHEYARLAEYDALFIRETTAPDNHTYRFAHKAEREDMVVMDDPTSILRCTNKIYLADLLKSKKLPTPRTEIVFKDDAKKLAQLGDLLGYPIVLKIPDGSFSRGIVKVADFEALKIGAEKLFAQTALVLAQEFIPTQFDWRIGVLNNQPLFACQYFMSRGHWQIYNHAAGTAENKTGAHKTLAVRDAPQEVVKLALKAAAAIGDSLYGVDIKLPAGAEGPVVIEVNDNPNIDAGVEDHYLGEDLYRRIMEEFVRRLERKRVGAP
jgi:glutathione synthase/RimK-type ligase-like ATP-grasp enzyme